MTKHLGWIGLLTLSLLMLASELFACPERMSDLTNNACRTTEATTLAGERNPTSSTDSYVVTRQEATATIITGTTAVTLGGGVAGDTHPMLLHIHTALTGTCVIDGFRDPGGSADTYILPVGTIGSIPLLGAINSAGALVITCSNAGDNKKVLALWRPR